MFFFFLCLPISVTVISIGCEYLLGQHASQSGHLLIVTWTQRFRVWEDTANILLLSVVMCFWPQHRQADWGRCLNLCHGHNIPRDSSCTKQGHLIHIARWWKQDSISKILRYNLMCSSLREEIGPVPDPFLSIALQFSVGECRRVSIQPSSLFWPSIERKRADTVFLSNLRLFSTLFSLKGFMFLLKPSLDFIFLY